MDTPNRCDQWFISHNGEGKMPFVLYFNRFMEYLDPEFLTKDGVLRIHSRELIDKWNVADAKFGLSYSLEVDRNA